MFSSRSAQRTLVVLAFAVVACKARDAGQGDANSSRLDAVASAPREAPAQPTASIAGQAATNGRALREGKVERTREVAGATDLRLRAPDAIQRVGRDSSAMPAMIVRNGTTSIEVDSLARAVALVRAIASRTGGFVANSSGQSGRDQVHSATLELRIPAARFDEAVNGLSPVGRVEGVNITAEDVGEEYVDVAARVANARKLEARLIELLANQTGKLVEVLAVERELSRVREEIERFEGRLRYLRAHTATSSLAVTLHEPFPIIAAAAHNPFTQAARDAWRNFVALLAAGIAALGYVVPLGAVAAVGYVTVRRNRVRPAIQ